MSGIPNNVSVYHGTGPNSERWLLYARAEGKQLRDGVALGGALLFDVSFGECPCLEDSVRDDTSVTR